MDKEVELFSKIYNCYYQVVARILDQSLECPISRTEMTSIADEFGFLETSLTIVPKLMSGEWNLIEEMGNNTFRSKIGHTSQLAFTNLQKSWLKSLMSDKRIKLFLTDELLVILEKELEGVEALYQSEDFIYFDQSLEGDLYESDSYRAHFQMILEAIETKKVLHFDYEACKGRHKEIDFSPRRIQYSSKNDKFRVLGGRVEHNKFIDLITINIGRVISISETNYYFDKEINVDLILQNRKVKEPVVIEISGKRNSLERCMLHFANYEKETTYDEQKDCYTSFIYYNKQDETELLIQILSFGPVIKVISPESFIKLVKERVGRQYHLLREPI